MEPACHVRPKPSTWESQFSLLIGHVEADLRGSARAVYEQHNAILHRRTAKNRSCIEALAHVELRNLTGYRRHAGMQGGIVSNWSPSSATAACPTIIKTNVADSTKKAARFLMIFTSVADSTRSA